MPATRQQPPRPVAGRRHLGARWRGATVALVLVPVLAGLAVAPPAGARGRSARTPAAGRVDLRPPGGARPVPGTVLGLLAGPGGLGWMGDGLSLPGLALAPPPASAATRAAPARFVAGGRDAPDPFALVAGGRAYLYSGQAFGSPVNVPVQSGPSLGLLGPVTDALPAPPPWAVAGFTWAPDVHRFGRRWVLYFTAEVAGRSPPEQCIGDAVADDPAGPFTPMPRPFVCQGILQGSIDPRTFVGARGRPYLLWKSDENAGHGHTPTGIWSQRLSADGLRLLGTPTKIFWPTQPWQERIVEAPDLVRADGADWLFYSGGWFNQPAYAVGVARCAGPSGPCTDRSPRPWLGSDAQGAGPGEESVLVDRDGAWLLYTPWHSWVPRLDTPSRPVAVARIGFGPAGPYLAAPGPLPGAASGGTFAGTGGDRRPGRHRVSATARSRRGADRAAGPHPPG